MKAVVPFCCDPNERIFEVSFGAEPLPPSTTCHWDFEDGWSKAGCQVQHRFAWRGEYSPTVTVSLADGTILTGTIEVEIGDELFAGEGSDPGGNPEPEPNDDVAGDEYPPGERPGSEGDGEAGPIEIVFLQAPEGDTPPGDSLVEWHFVGGEPTGVRLHRRCCSCSDAQSAVLTPDLNGVYREYLDVPADRHAWYFVSYLEGDVQSSSAAVFTNPPASVPVATERQRVIWAFVGSRDNPESVATAVKTGLISHVAIFAGNRVTSDTLNTPQTAAVIEIARHAGAELILIRGLWQTQPGPDSELSVLVDADYYVEEIARAREDAARIGATAIGFDAETYGPTPLSEYFRRPDGFREADYEALQATILGVIGQTGQADYVLPAGSIRDFHPYGALAQLGRERITESTYYDNEQDIDWTPYPYDLAAMCAHVTKTRPQWPYTPYFLPHEVFGSKAHIWTRTQGLMIWPKEHGASELADQFAVFAGTCAD